MFTLPVFAQIASNKSLDLSYHKNKFCFKELTKHLTVVSLLPHTVLLIQLCLRKLWVGFIIGKVTFQQSMCVLSLILTSTASEFFWHSCLVS